MMLSRILCPICSALFPIIPNVYSYIIPITRTSTIFWWCTFSNAGNEKILVFSSYTTTKQDSLSIIHTCINIIIHNRMVKQLTVDFGAINEQNVAQVRWNHVPIMSKDFFEWITCVLIDIGGIIIGKETSCQESDFAMRLWNFVKYVGFGL